MCKQAQTSACDACKIPGFPGCVRRSLVVWIRSRRSCTSCRRQSCSRSYDGWLSKGADAPANGPACESVAVGVAAPLSVAFVALERATVGPSYASNHEPTATMRPNIPEEFCADLPHLGAVQGAVGSGMEDALEFSVGPWQNLSESFSWGEATAALPSQVPARYLQSSAHAARFMKSVPLQSPCRCRDFRTFFALL